MPTATQVLNVARSQIADTETPPGSNRQKYGEWYGLNGVSWCAIFQSWCFSRFPNGLGAVGGKHSYTPEWAKWFQDHGRWSKHPEVGALVFYGFPGERPGVNHVGIVEAVLSNGFIQTIEGNTVPGAHGGEGVWRRIRSPQFVIGYGLPSYSIPVAPHAAARRAAPKVKPAARVSLIRRLLRVRPKAPAFPLPHGRYYGPRLPLSNARSVSGYYGGREGLRTFQRRLRAIGFTGIRVTGRYDDSNTEHIVRDFQRKHGLQVDGLVGPSTWAAVWR